MHEKYLQGKKAGQGFEMITNTFSSSSLKAAV